MPYRKPQIGPPWGGWLDGLPGVAAKANSFRQITNWIVNKGRLQTGPSLFGFSGSASGAPFLRIRSFPDSAGGWHTMGLTTVDLEALTVPGGTFAWVEIPFPIIMPVFNAATVPWAIEIFNNIAYFSAGPQPLMFWTGGIDDDLTNFNYNYGIAGDVPGGCFFLGKLAGRLIMLNTTENGWNFPRRMRWSALNNANEWNFTLDPTAGATDIPEIEDSITGWSVAYNVGYIYRNHGITSVTPTGNSSIPFLIQNYNAGPKGVGVFTPYTLATWGSTSIFRAEHDIFQFDGGQLTGIGASAKKSILNDIDFATNTVSSAIIGNIAPGVDYLTYWLICPVSNNLNNAWVYHFDDQTWVKYVIQSAAPGSYISCVDSVFLQ